MTRQRRNGGMAARDHRDRERVLWVNVILQAVRDATDTKNCRTPEATRLEARAWFDPKNESFCDVCFFAGMDPERVYVQATEAIQRFDTDRGLVSDFRGLQGTGAGGTAQEMPEITFSKEVQTA